ncbi:phospholipase D family protein [Psychrobacter sp. FDAARGOS_221]|uniref:phospholipase D family protein n=1 Tax=Psychrobacter sp. FDAARGOS_221 TaxID=1975705 RepID=UPI000BB536C7|nr:phospholipase D family protein [Psychrobacter sp. FDAARGOS_221]PNK61811.1 phospholipase D family protein [Psychrobacter sp. FDAARGOS_221]
MGSPLWLLLVILILPMLSACNTLPAQPHTAKSVRLSNLLESHYKDADRGDKQTILNAQAPNYQPITNPYTERQKIRLTESINEQSELHPNQSGYHTIITGSNAFAARSVLSDMARESIDVQYYIWHNDQAGQLLLKKLWQAAERGVIVRFLLDDFNNTAALDKHLLRFASHPNIAVRLVNPLSHRKLQTLNYVTDLRRINHRMHNKSMTFDRNLSIIGGRNVGDEYLSNNEFNQFADLDVLLIGDVVDEVTDSFDRYWRSPLAFDIETLVKPSLADKRQSHVQSNTQTNTNNNADKSSQTPVSANTTQTSNGKLDFIGQLDKISFDERGNKAQSLTAYLQALQKSRIDIDLINKQVPFRWAPMTFLDDDVDKLVNDASVDSHLVYKLRDLLGTPDTHLSIISSYFVPTKDGVATLIKLAEQGVQVKILTNSFNATDVAAVHAGYAQWRLPLLKAGVEIYELKATAGTEERENKLWRARSQSSTSLHAKAFAVDDHHVFIGSYNVDPRSANINTEMGVVIEDSELADKLHAAISEDLLPQAYRLVLTPQDELRWQTIEDGMPVIHEKEPDVGFMDSFWITVMSLMPIDWLL